MRIGSQRGRKREERLSAMEERSRETRQEHALVDELQAVVAQLSRDGALDRVSELLAGIAPADEKAARETRE